MNAVVLIGTPHFGSNEPALTGTTFHHGAVVYSAKALEAGLKTVWPISSLGKDVEVEDAEGRERRVPTTSWPGVKGRGRG